MLVFKLNAAILRRRRGGTGVTGEMEEARREEKIGIIGEKRFGGRRIRKGKDEKLL